MSIRKVPKRKIRYNASSTSQADARVQIQQPFLPTASYPDTTIFCFFCSNKLFSMRDAFLVILQFLLGLSILDEVVKKLFGLICRWLKQHIAALFDTYWPHSEPSTKQSPKMDVDLSSLIDRDDPSYINPKTAKDNCNEKMVRFSTELESNGRLDSRSGRCATVVDEKENLVDCSTSTSSSFTHQTESSNSMDKRTRSHPYNVSNDHPIPSTTFSKDKETHATTTSPLQLAQRSDQLESNSEPLTRSSYRTINQLRVTALSQRVRERVLSKVKLK